MKHLKSYFYYSNKLAIKESFSLILENEVDNRVQLPGLKIVDKIDISDLKKKRKRIDSGEIMSNTIKTVEEPAHSNIVKKHHTEEFNCKFNIYFKEEHVKQRMEERNITENEVINLVKKSIKDMIYFSFKYKFNILKADLNNVNNNSFMIKYFHNQGNEISIPVNVICKNISKKNEYDIIVHTVLNYDFLRMWDGQYVINVHDDEQAELFIKRNGSLIPVE